jgi:PilZ domain
VNRRQYPRVNVSVFCRPIGKPLFGRRRATDVSLGGLRLYADEPAQVGDRLALELFLPDDRQVECRVEVVWVEELPAGSPARFDVGLKYIEIDPEIRALLLTVLAKPD